MKKEIENSRHQISTFGTVFNRNGSIIKPRIDKDGYMVVKVALNNKRVNQFVHRLVAKAFIPNPENKPQVNHKNGIRNDNRVENLEWVTASENHKHAYRELGKKPTIARPTAIIDFTKADQIRLKRLSGFSISDLCKEYGIKQCAVYNVLANKTWITE